MGNTTQKSSVTDVSPTPSIQNPFRVPLQNVTNQVLQPINPRPSRSNGTNFVENSPTPTVPLSCVFQSLKHATQRARVVRKEILDNKRTIGLTTSNRGNSSKSFHFTRAHSY